MGLGFEFGSQRINTWIKANIFLKNCLLLLKKIQIQHLNDFFSIKVSHFRNTFDFIQVGLKMPKWVLIVWPKRPQMLQSLSAKNWINNDMDRVRIQKLQASQYL